MKLLLLGHTGKMGNAIKDAFRGDEPICKSSREFSALDPAQVSVLIRKIKPEVVINAIALTGIDKCEHEADNALKLNAQFPRQLAELATELGFTLVHFSSDAVFGDNSPEPYTEDDMPSPLNIYGLTKYGGDCFIRAACKKHYIVRVPFLFGPGGDGHHLVDRLLARAFSGETPILVADDVIISPSYSCDIAEQVRRLVIERAPYGLYHIANEGTTSPYELFSALAKQLGLTVRVEKGSFRDFPLQGRKNLCTPLRSVRMKSLRNWREALEEYSAAIRNNKYISNCGVI